MKLLPRAALTRRLQQALRRRPAVVLLGPRQCGKTTLARQLFATRQGHYFDLEDPADLARLDAPMLALERLRGLVVIDEVQRRPELFPVLRVLLDRRPVRARFLVLGSAAPDLLAQTSESLAGRAALLRMGGLMLDEVDPARWRTLWVRGGFPDSFLARGDGASHAWRRDFIQTFLERDLAQLGIRTAAATIRRFWTMLAHSAGGIWNASEIGRSLGEAHTTVRRHLDALSGALVVRVLDPWHVNLAKRQVKSPKAFIRDTGLLHALLGIESLTDLQAHPRLGASWESFVIEQILARAGNDEAWFWRTQAGAELDLLLRRRGRLIGVEIKYGDAPRLTPSMRAAMTDLQLHRLWVVYPGQKRYRLAPRIEVVPLADAIAELAAD
jgi:predicted AAA+ superfamily ATPase